MMMRGSIPFRLTAWYFLSLALMLALFGFGARLAMQSSVFQAVDHDLRLRIRDVNEFLNQQMNSEPDDLKDEFRERLCLAWEAACYKCATKQAPPSTGPPEYRSTVPV
jgi:hypothetical protein